MTTASLKLSEDLNNNDSSTEANCKAQFSSNYLQDVSIPIDSQAETNNETSKMGSWLDLEDFLKSLQNDSSPSSDVTANHDSIVDALPVALPKISDVFVQIALSFPELAEPLPQMPIESPDDELDELPGLLEELLEMMEQAGETAVASPGEAAAWQQVEPPRNVFQPNPEQAQIFNAPVARSRVSSRIDKSRRRRLTIREMKHCAILSQLEMEWALQCPFCLCSTHSMDYLLRHCGYYHNGKLPNLRHFSSF